MDVVGVKVIVIFLFGFSKLFSGLLPLVLKRIMNKGGLDWIEKILSGVICFGGGVLLATVFIHMLPEVRDGIELARQAAGHAPRRPGDFAYAEVVVCGGFFLVYLIESLVQRIFNLHHSHSHGLPLDEEHGHSHGNEKDEHKNEKAAAGEQRNERKILASIRNFIMVVALSIHSVFEGMAVGLQKNSTDVWLLFMAVIIHEIAILFCVGNEMVKNGMKKLPIITYMSILSIISPLGIFIGLMLTMETTEQVGADTSMAANVLQGIAAGTLLYITFFEVLERDKLQSFGMNGLLGCFIILAGFAFMTGVTAIGEHFGQTNTGSNSSTPVNSTSLSFFF